MLLDSITIAPPTGDPFVIARTPAFAEGARAGAVLDTVNVGPPRRKLNRDEFLYRRGELVVPGPWLARDVEVTGWLIAASRAHVNDVRAALVRACGVFGNDRTAVRYQPSDVEVELYCYAGEDGVRVETDGGSRLRFTVRFVADDPVAYRAGPASVAALSGTPTTVTNAGDVTVYPTVTVTPGSGAITALTLSNDTTGESFALSGINVGTGDTLTVVMAPGREEVDDAGVNIMNRRTSGSRFWGLAPGDNQVKLSQTGGSSVVAQLEWRDGWVGL